MLLPTNEISTTRCPWPGSAYYTDESERKIGTKKRVKKALSHRKGFYAIEWVFRRLVSFASCFILFFRTRLLLHCSSVCLCSSVCVCVGVFARGRVEFPINSSQPRQGELTIIYVVSSRACFFLMYIFMYIFIIVFISLIWFLVLTITGLSLRSNNGLMNRR